MTGTCDLTVKQVKEIHEMLTTKDAHRAIIRPLTERPGKDVFVTAYTTYSSRFRFVVLEDGVVLTAKQYTDLTGIALT